MIVCRAYPETLTKSILNEDANKNLFYQKYREERFEKEIMEASHQQNLVCMPVLSANVLHDTSKGGAYSKNLFACSTDVKDEYKLVGFSSSRSKYTNHMRIFRQNIQKEILLEFIIILATTNNSHTTLNTKHEPPTRVLLQAGHDVGAIGFQYVISSSFGSTNKARQKFLSSNYKKTRQQFRAGRFSNPPPAAIPVPLPAIL